MSYKFYEFKQNNSGGRFWFTDAVGYSTYVEASTEEEALEIFGNLPGVYFDGVTAGLDCGCCGDRFDRNAWDASEEEALSQPEWPWHGAHNVVHYKDGAVIVVKHLAKVRGGIANVSK